MFYTTANKEQRPNDAENKMASYFLYNMKATHDEIIKNKSKFVK